MVAIRTIFKYILKGGLKSPFLLYAYLKKSGLWFPIALFLNVIPSIIGTYQFYTSEGVPFFISIPTAIGSEFGGALVTVISLAQSYMSGTGVSKYVALVSLISPLVSVLFMWGAFVGYAKFQEGQNVSKSGIWKATALFFGLTMVLTMTVDMYALDDDVDRRSGLVYFAENWENNTEAFLDSPYTQEAINRTAPDESVLNKNFTKDVLDNFNRGGEDSRSGELNQTE